MGSGGGWVLATGAPRQAWPGSGHSGGAPATHLTPWWPGAGGRPGGGPGGAGASPAAVDRTANAASWVTALWFKVY